MGGARGLLQFKDVRNVESEPGLPALTNLDVSALGQDAQGRLWVGTRQGELWWRDNGQWLARKERSARPCHHRHRAAARTAPCGWERRAMDCSVVESKAGGHWRKQNGLLSDWVRTLYLDAEGTLWIGTGGGGLSRLKDGQVATFTTREGLPDNTISQILEDDADNLWLGGDLGIVCVSKQELDDTGGPKNDWRLTRRFMAD